MRDKKAVIKGKQIVPISERIDKKMKELRKLKEAKKSEYTHLRVSRINAAIIDDIWAILEIDSLHELEELKIKNLTRDDVITALLISTMQTYGISTDRLNTESNYLKVVAMKEHNNIIGGE